jgi:hypothetical protein
MEFAEFINGGASLIVGHRAILIESGINPVVVDQMCYNLHSYFLGRLEDDDSTVIFEVYEEDDEDEET